MFQHRLEQSVGRTVVFHWFLMSFNGGAINAGGFLATGRFVSHVTGFATQFGVAIYTESLGIAAGLLSVPLFFLLGAFVAGIMVDRPLRYGKPPRFGWVMGLSAMCLGAAAGGANSFNFGSFGEDARFHQNYLLLALLCLASGLQNAAITSSSGGSVRTTHLTGLTTDLGLGLSRIAFAAEGRFMTAQERKLNLLRVGSIFSFVVGSALGAFVFLRFGYNGFLLPAAISAYAALFGRRIS
jgi:uncharacterized membrane protein YoaK (UPF0700 family)